MSWTMPHRALQIVAFLLLLAAAGSFALGVATTPQRGGRLPGEKAALGAKGAAVIDAEEAAPLSEERIEGPPPPTPEEIAKAEAEAEAKKRAAAEAAAQEEADAAANAAPAGNMLLPIRPPAVLPGNAAPAEPPPADEPPH